MSRKFYLTLAVALLLLTVAPAHAAPPLSQGSNASYRLTGTVVVKQSCTADPVAYASQACAGMSSSNSKTPQTLPTPFQVDFNGTIGWVVDGLSSSEANLFVSHNVGLSVSPIPLISITPVTESGSFEQSVDLSTRVESPSTATGVLFGSALDALPRASLTASLTGPLLKSILANGLDGREYTEWWVNGPLSSGSLIQILNGWSSVTGSESLDFGGSVGTRSGWIVTSQLSQTLNIVIPDPNNILGPWPTSTGSGNLNLLWSFDQNADLLLRTNDTLSLRLHIVTPMTINNGGSVCVPGTTYCVSTPVIVSVTRDMSVTANVSLRLYSTNLIVKTPGTGSQPSTPANLFASMPWMPIGIAGIAAGFAVALTFWLTRRARRTPLQRPH